MVDGKKRELTRRRPSHKESSRSSSSTQATLLTMFAKKTPAIMTRAPVTPPMTPRDEVIVLSSPDTDIDQVLPAPESSSPPPQCSSPTSDNIDLEDKYDTTLPHTTRIKNARWSTVRFDSFQRRPSGSRSDPITLNSSPVKNTPLNLSEGLHHAPPTSPTKPIHPFFSPIKHVAPPSTAMNRTIGAASEAPYPRQDFQHVRAEQTEFPTRRRPLSASSKGKEPIRTSLEGDISWITSNSPDFSDGSPATMISLCSEHNDCDLTIASLPEIHQGRHPAIARILTSASSSQPSTSFQESWTTRWRPRRAEEVLGNEDQALYLRDWLKELALRDRSSTSFGITVGSDAVKRGLKRKKDKALSTGTVSGKNPRVVREVKRQRGRKKRVVESDGDDNAWIVADDEVEFETESASVLNDGTQDDIEFAQETYSLLSRHLQTGVSSSQDTQPSDRETSFAALDLPRKHDFSNHLTNAILLAGPSGVGKTAAVYACAEELGWQVFEVNPGMGKRSGGSLNALVGDVGKNHIVNSSARNKKAPATPSGIEKKGSKRDAFTALLSRGRKVVEEDGEEGDSGSFQERRSERDGCASHAEVGPSLGSIADARSMEMNVQNDAWNRTVRQSIILLEEVDILFKEDVNFWPTVVELIKHSMRPVIMTCNDASLVPRALLPLQDTLVFSACRPSLATSYLQCLCTAEGYPIPRENLAQIWANHTPVPRKTHCRGARGSEEASVQLVVGPVLGQVDLRWFINHAQLYCTSGKRTSGVEKPPDVGAGSSSGRDLEQLQQHRAAEDASDDPQTPNIELRNLVRSTEARSFAHAFLVRDDAETWETIANDSFRETPDDVVGQRPLRNSWARGQLDSQAPAVGTIFEACLHIIHGPVLTSSSEYTWPSHTRRASLTAALGQLKVPVATQGVACDRVFLDYAPWVRTMLDTDDALDAASQAEAAAVVTAAAGRKRMTRNSQLAASRYVRTFVAVDEDARRAIQGDRLAW